MLGKIDDMPVSDGVQTQLARANKSAVDQMTRIAERAVTKGPEPQPLPPQPSGGK